MRARVVVSLVAVLGLTLAACGSDGDRGTSDGGTKARSTTTTTAPPTASVVLHAHNVELFYDCDTCENRGLRVGLQSPDTTARVRVGSWTHADQFAVYACPVADLATPGAVGRMTTQCTKLAPGTAVEIAHGPGHQGVEGTMAPSNSFRGTPAPPNAIVLDDVTVSYATADRTTVLQGPRIPAPAGASACKDNACNPFFELTPFRAGSLDADAHWGADTPVARSAGRLEILVGEVATHRMSEVGIPYAVPATADGPSPLHVTSTVPSTESAVALADLDGGRPLQGVALHITWP